MLYAVDRVMKPANYEEVDEMAVTAFHLGAATQVDEFLRAAFDRVNRPADVHPGGGPIPPSR